VKRMSEPMPPLVEGDELIPGDVVLDMANHNPLLVTGVSMMGADRVDEVWKSRANHEMFDIGTESDIYETIYLPRGNGVMVPDDTHCFPSERLRRVPTEAATGDRRVQKTVVRSVIAHMIADMRNTDRAGQAEIIESQLRRMFDNGYAAEITEIADAIAEEGFVCE